MRHLFLTTVVLASRRRCAGVRAALLGERRERSLEPVGLGAPFVWCSRERQVQLPSARP